MTSPEAVVYLTLGSNIEPQANLKTAVRLLRQRCTLLALSPVYRSPPQGDTQQADFLNMAVKLTTTLTPAEFKTSVIGAIERQLGRVRDPHNKNAPRTIDLDIALWDDTVFEYGAKPWHIPDPDIRRFAHVAVPLADLAPDYRHPEVNQTLAEIAAGLDRAQMQCIPFDFEDEARVIVNIEGAIWRDGRYLTAVRGHEETHAAGLLGFVGGKVEFEPGDDVFENTLRREIREEVNLEVTDIIYVNSRLFMADDGVPVINVLFLCRYAGGVVEIQDPGEVAAADWQTPAEITANPQTPPWIQDYVQLVEARRLQLGW
jgi:2-amino-4-hydroxy-6-hydroxymethyldihydropteridine diphosphokinase